MIDHVNCPALFQSQTELDLIDHDNSIFFQCRSHLYDQSCRYPVWFSSLITLSQICPDSSVSVSAQTRPIQSVMLLSCMVFIIEQTCFDWSGQLSFIFCINHIYTISHIDVLSSFGQSQHPSRSVTTVQFRENICYIYTIGHVVVMSCFRHNLHSV